MQALPFLTAATVQKAPIGETFLAAIPHLLGMLVVMITLTILWGLCELTAYLLKRFAPAVEPAAHPAAPPVTHDTPAARVAASDSAISPEIVVVVAAAVNTVIGGDYRVVSIKPQDSNWEKAGRQSVLSSHRIR